MTAYAKLNPVLGIIGTENGLHRLDTVILPIAFGDTVTVMRRGDKTSTVRIVNGADIVGNTALRLANAVVEKYGVTGVDIEIAKKIPVGAGLGGSSADAAAVMRAMCELYGLQEPDGTFLCAIGSDVLAQYRAVPTRLIGTGTSAEPLCAFPSLTVAILAGGGARLTKDVFARYDREGGAEGDIGAFLEAVGKRAPLPLFNALEVSADAPMRCEKIALLQNAGFSAIGMTGSGSAYAGYSYRPISKSCERSLIAAAQKIGLYPILTKTLNSKGGVE